MVGVNPIGTGVSDGSEAATSCRLLGAGQVFLVLAEETKKIAFSHFGSPFFFALHLCKHCSPCVNKLPGVRSVASAFIRYKSFCHSKPVPDPYSTHRTMRGEDAQHRSCIQSYALPMSKKCTNLWSTAFSHWLGGSQQKDSFQPSLIPASVV